MNDIRALIEKLDQINEASPVDNVINDVIKKDGLPKNIGEVEDDIRRITKSIRTNLQSRDDDSFLTSVERFFKRGTVTQGYIQRQYLGIVAEKLKLPGLYTSDGNYVYVDKDNTGNYKSAANSSLEDAVKLYKAGWVTRDKAIELRKNNLNRAFRDEKSIANELFNSPPGPAADWVKTNPLPDDGLPDAPQPDVKKTDGNVSIATGKADTLPLPGAGRTVDPSLTGAGNDSGVKTFPVEPPPKISISQSMSEYVSKKLSKADIEKLSSFKVDEISGELINELRKLLNVLNDSKLNFKSDIALSLVESDKLYEKELSGPDEEKLKIIIHNLKLLEPKINSAVVRARVKMYLESVPKKYLNTTVEPSSSAQGDEDPIRRAEVENRSGVKYGPGVSLDVPFSKDFPAFRNATELKMDSGKVVAVDKDGKVLGTWDGESSWKATTPSTNTAPVDKPAANTAPTASNKKITWKDLVKLNPQIKNPNLIYPGQEIKLPNGSSAIVDQGDTLGSLAQRYNDGGYSDGTSVDKPAAQAAPAEKPAAQAAPAEKPAAQAAPAAPTLKPAEAAAISVKIKTALLSLRNQNALDRIWMDIKSKENFDAIDAQFRTTGKQGIIDAVRDEWFYNMDKQFNPMLKRLGIAVK